MRLIDLPLQRGNVEVVQGHTLQWWDEPVTGVSVFRVTSGFPKPALEKINQLLAAKQWQEIGQYFACQAAYSSQFRVQTDADFNIHASASLINRQLFSARIEEVACCAGKNCPQITGVTINLDMTTGQEMDLGDIFWLGDGKASFEVNGDSPQAIDYREKALAPWLAKTMKMLYPDQIKQASVDGCELTNLEVWQ